MGSRRGSRVGLRGIAYTDRVRSRNLQIRPNPWADALTIEARSLPSPQMIISLRPGNDPITIRLGDGQLIDDPVWGTLCMWVDKMNSRDLLKKIANRRGTCIDVTLSGQVFMKRRAGLAIFSHLAPRTDSDRKSVV